MWTAKATFGGFLFGNGNTPGSRKKKSVAFLFFWNINTFLVCIQSLVTIKTIWHKLYALFRIRFSIKTYLGFMRNQPDAVHNCDLGSLKKRFYKYYFQKKSKQCGIFLQPCAFRSLLVAN